MQHPLYLLAVQDAGSQAGRTALNLHIGVSQWASSFTIAGCYLRWNTDNRVIKTISGITWVGGMSVAIARNAAVVLGGSSIYNLEKGPVSWEG